MIHWQVTSQQYEALVFATDRDRLPYPTWNTLRANDSEELGRQRKEAIETLQPRVDDELANLMTALVDPQVRLHVHGRLGADPDNPESEIRGCAGFGPSTAAVAIQAPDPEPGVSGDVRLSVCTHKQALHLLADMLPSCPPGRHELAGKRADLDLEPEWVGGWNRPPTLRERLDRFMSRPRSGWGEVLCYQGRFLDNRTDGVQGFLWMDFPRDGRYYVRADDVECSVQPMTPDRFVAHSRALARQVRDASPTRPR